MVVMTKRNNYKWKITCRFAALFGTAYVPRIIGVSSRQQQNPRLSRCRMLQLVLDIIWHCIWFVLRVAGVNSRQVIQVSNVVVGTEHSDTTRPPSTSERSE